ncbi:ABC transporter permease [Acidiluteibacter ferrifornacis]|nr:FtsX-like permease family protein [Acidiluteibacter ferrifornacis]
MNLPLHIARKYLFSKKTKNIINIISWISMLSIGVGSLALIVVLSVFNGLQSLVESMYESFEPDIKITASKGKTIDLSLFPLEEIEQMEGVIHYSKVIEEVVGVKNGEKQCIATIKGVEESFLDMSNLDSVLVDGSAVLKSNGINYAIVGYGIAVRLSMYLQSGENLSIYIPKRGNVSSLNLASAFTFKQITPSSIFYINPDIDDKYIVVPLEFIQSSLDYENKITSLELSIASKDQLAVIQERLQQKLGDEYKVENRYEMNALLYKTNQAEKWITFMILAFILLIAAFNILSSLTILIMDKKEDIKVLRSMGASKKLIQKIFFTEGILINLIGAGGGLLLGTIICLIQQHFGILKLSGGIVEYYPVELQGLDFILILFTVILIGGLSSYLPVKVLTKKLL